MGVKYKMRLDIKKKGQQHVLCPPWRILTRMDWNEICRITGFLRLPLQKAPGKRGPSCEKASRILERAQSGSLESFGTGSPLHLS